MKARAFLVAMFLTAPAFAQEPPPPLPPPLPPPGKPADKPADQHDVVIEYVPAPGQPAPAPTTNPTPAPTADTVTPPPPSEEQQAKKLRTSFRAEGGFQYSQLYGVPITGARVRLGIGTQNDKYANYATVSALYGGTENDLRTWDFRVGYTGDYLKVSVLRLGLDAEIGYLVVHRATLDDRMFALGMGAGVHAGFDLYSFGPRNDHAVTAQARFDASLHFGGAFVWGPAILVGFRY